MVGALGAEVAQQRRRARNLRAQLAQLVSHGLHVGLEAPVRVQQQQEVVRPKLGLRGRGRAVLCGCRVHAEQARQALGQLLDVQVRVEALRVGGALRVVAQLVRREDVEPSHALVQPDGQRVAQPLHRDVRADGAEAVPHEAVRSLEVGAPVRAQDAQQVHHRGAECSRRAEQAGHRVVGGARELLDGQRGRGHILLLVHALEGVELAFSCAPLALNRWAHLHAGAHDGAPALQIRHILLVFALVGGCSGSGERAAAAAARAAGGAADEGGGRRE